VSTILINFFEFIFLACVYTYTCVYMYVRVYASTAGPLREW